MTRLSCRRFRSNEVRLWLSVIAYNLGNLWRRLVLPKGTALSNLSRAPSRPGVHSPRASHFRQALCLEALKPT